MDAPALRPFRRSFACPDPFLFVTSEQGRGIIYSYAIEETTRQLPVRLVSHKAACGLGALLAALRHHHGPDDTAGIKAPPQGWKQWKRTGWCATAEERSEAIQYLEQQLGQLGKPSGSWEEALSLSMPESRRRRAGGGEQAEESRRGRQAEESRRRRAGRGEQGAGRGEQQAGESRRGRAGDKGSRQSRLWWKWCK